MLSIIEKFKDINYDQILSVYAEQVCDFAAEKAFLEDMDLFFRIPNVFCFLWTVQSRYVTCVRVEPYMDGCLMTCLETAPESRRRGYARSLIQSAAEYLQHNGFSAIYVHIAKNNSASLQLHHKAGFSVVADYGRLVDGTISQKYFTLAKRLS